MKYAVQLLQMTILWALPGLTCWSSVRTLVDLASTDSRYTHIAAMPLLSLALVYLRRRRILLRQQEGGRTAGLAVLAVGLLLCAFWRDAPAETSVHVGFLVTGIAIVLVWIGGAILVLGREGAAEAAFPLSLLVLAVPLPPDVVGLAEVGLQHASAEVTHAIFVLTRTPVFREALVFSLPGLTIEVAQECSGIRSTIALLITTLVLGNLLLRSNWSRALLVVLAVPVAILKNAVRITTLSWLGVYVSPDYLEGNLHHSGGPVFSVLSLALTAVPLWALCAYERRSAIRNRALPSVHDREEC